MRRFFLTTAAATLLAAGQAHAHAFDAGADFYQQFLEGVGVILFYPASLLPIMALGILLSLWDREGLPRVWLIYLGTFIAGVFLGSFVSPVVVPILMFVGLVTAALAALLQKHTRPVAMVLTALIGLLAAAVSLEGHGLFELTIFIYAGIFLGANLALAVSAGLARVALEKVEAGWMRIGVRVAASWIGAALVLMLAFTFAGTA